MQSVGSVDGDLGPVRSYDYNWRTGGDTRHTARNIVSRDETAGENRASHDDTAVETDHHNNDGDRTVDSDGDGWSERQFLSRRVSVSVEV